MKPGVPSTREENLNYLVRLNEKTLDWYKIADTKGQLLLTLDGVFITVVATTVVAEPQDLVGRLAAAGNAGMALLLVSAASIAGSVLCAVACLYSRLSDARLERIADQEFGVDPVDRMTYSPRIAGWFGFIASIARSARRDGGMAAARFMPEYLQGVDGDAEREMLASQVVALSQNVLAKHRWVDRGWVLAGAALIGLIGFGLAFVFGAQ